MKRVFPILLLLTALWATSAAAQAPKTIHVTTLHWLPYVSERLPQQGWLSFVAQTAAQQAGYRLEIDYFPWLRAMQLGQKDASYAGYFPAYYTDERAQSCYFSLPLDTSTLGLAYLDNAPLHWTSMEDLVPLKLAVVTGYSNGVQFDTWARTGKLQVEASPNDLLNLRKLLAGRVDAVVIDQLVLRYLLLTEPSLGKQGRRILFHDKPLAELPLHLCFQRTPDGRIYQQALNKALRSLPLQRLEQDYFRQLERSISQSP